MYYSALANVIIDLLNRYPALSTPFRFFSLIYCTTVGNSLHYFCHTAQQMLLNPRLLGFNLDCPEECHDTIFLKLLYEHLNKLKRKVIPFRYGKVVPRYQPCHNSISSEEKLIESVEALVEAFARLLSLPRAELYRQRDMLHHWLCNFLVKRCHQVGPFIAHTVANVAALCLGPNELVALCSNVSVASTTKTWSRIREYTGAADQDHRAASRSLLSAIAFVTEEPYHTGEEGLCQWGQELAGTENNFRTSLYGGCILSRAMPNAHSPGRFDLVRVSHAGFLGPHRFLTSLEFERVNTTIDDPFWKDTKGPKKKTYSSKGVKREKHDFPLLPSRATTVRHSLPVPNPVQILMKIQTEKPFVSMDGIVVDGLQDRAGVLVKKQRRIVTKTSNEMYVAIGFSYPIELTERENIWVPADFCLHRGTSVLVQEGGGCFLRYFRRSEDAHSYAALYLALERPDLKYNSVRCRQLTEFKTSTIDLCEDDKRDSIADFRVFTTDKKTRCPNFVVVLYHSGSIGVVLVDTFGRPVSNVHMKHKCEVAVRQGRRGVPDDCECLGIRRNRMSEDKSVEIEVALQRAGHSPNGATGLLA